MRPATAPNAAPVRSAPVRRTTPRALAASRGKRPHIGRRALVLLGAVAIPAFAAPDEWHGLEIGDALKSETPVEPMPFEKPGSSFPGSAFYYLAADDAAPAGADWSDLAPDAHSDASPAARALRIGASSGLDQVRALQCLTAAIYYEAASEPDAGQRAVAQVVLNRVAHPAYPNTVCGVVYQGSERSTGCQFTFTCDGSLARKPSPLFWDRARKVAATALAGYVYAPVGLATHYHTVQVHPYWADKLRYLGTIGMHRFYSFGGKAGQPATFRFAYLGGEPVAAPFPRSATAPKPESLADPVAIQSAYSSANTEARAESPASHAAPAYSQEVRQRGGDALYRGDKLPESTGIRAEYRNSGRWISQPGT